VRDNKFAYVFPSAFAPEPLLRFNSFEFSTAIARKLGLPIPLLASHIGANIKTEGGSARATVDPYVNSVAAAPVLWADIQNKCMLFSNGTL
jgi:hypothetical protein